MNAWKDSVRVANAGRRGVESKVNIAVGHGGAMPTMTTVTFVDGYHDANHGVVIYDRPISSKIYYVAACGRIPNSLRFG